MEKRIKLSTLIYSILVILIAVITVSSVLAYGTQTQIGKKIAASMSKIIPFPAAIIGYTHVVFMSDVEKNLASVEKFYDTQDLSKEGLRVDFTTPDGQKRLEIKKREILDKLVEDKIIEVLAEKYNISVPKTDIDKSISQKLAEYGTSKDVKTELFNLYGWDLDDFKQRVILPSLYKDALTAYAASQDSENSKSQAKIKEAQSELNKGKDFAQVVNAFSEGASKENKGELGWVTKDQVLPELQDALFSSKSIEKKAIIESSIGFHIVEVENKKKENGVDVLQLKQIFVAKNTFADWLSDEKKQIRIIIPLSEFTWDSASGSVDFRNQDMRTFEREERSKAKGDASIMF